MKMHMPILTVVEKAAQDAMREAGRAVLKRARELSPTDTGESDKSGFVAVDDLTVQVGFTSLVSLLQHEKLEWHHPDGGQAKFLEHAVDQLPIDRLVAERVRAALNG